VLFRSVGRRVAGSPALRFGGQGHRLVGSAILCELIQGF
jgi:hypothetical protein